MGLIEGGDPASESVTKGIEFLLARQTPEGWWRERAWTRIICPGLAYARDEARSHRDAVQAIEKFMQATIRGTNG
jgi:squalene cyclase